MKLEVHTNLISHVATHQFFVLNDQVWRVTDYSAINDSKPSGFATEMHVIEPFQIYRVILANNGYTGLCVVHVSMFVIYVPSPLTMMVEWLSV